MVSANLHCHWQEPSMSRQFSVRASVQQGSSIMLTQTASSSVQSGGRARQPIQQKASPSWHWLVSRLLQPALSSPPAAPLKKPPKVWPGLRRGTASAGAT